MDMTVAPAERDGESSNEPWEVPAGWCWTDIGSVARLRGVKIDPKAAPELRFVGMDDIAHNGLTILQTKPFSEMKSVGNKFEAGDILYGRLRPYLNKTAIAKTEGAASGELLAIVSDIEPRFVQFYLHSRRFVNQALSTVSGDRPRIDFGTICSFQFPLCPLPEQRRIVETIDALFAEIVEGEAALEEARRGLETFRRSLLKAAVTGELTRDWREANRSNETGHDLLARIRINTNGNATKGRGRRTQGNGPLDTSSLPELPEGWAWATLGEIGEIVGGATVDAKRKPIDPVIVPYLRVANVQRGHIDLAHVKQIVVERTTAEKLQLVAGDILLNEGGDRDKIGRGWVWNDSVSEMIHQNHVFRVRARDAGLSPYFISHYANEMGRRFFLEQGKQTTNLASISLTKVSQLPVPVPPPNEATEIISRLTSGLEEVQETIQLLDVESADAAQLRQAILKSAFEGTLVPQDQDDEPASVLLDRLKQAASGTQSPRRGRMRRVVHGI